MSSAETVVDQSRKLVGIVEGYVAKLPRGTKFTLGDRFLGRCALARLLVPESG